MHFYRLSLSEIEIQILQTTFSDQNVSTVFDRFNKNFQVIDFNKSCSKQGITSVEALSRTVSTPFNDTFWVARTTIQAVAQDVPSIPP